MATITPEFRARIDRMPERIRVAAAAAMEQGADEIVSMMQRLAPVDDGELRASIAWTWGEAPAGTMAVTTIRGGKGGGREVAALRLTIYANAKDAKGRPYASWVEFGTKRSAASPYFWPSYRALRKRVTGRIYRAIRKAIREK